MNIKGIQIFFVLFSCLVSFSMLGQKAVERRVITYEGKIGSYPIRLYMEYMESNSIYGHYTYKKYPNNEPIGISGTYHKGDLRMGEEVYSFESKKMINTGLFTAKDFQNFDVVSGIWTNMLTSKQLDFELIAVEKQPSVQYFYTLNTRESDDSDIQKHYYEFDAIKLYDSNRKFLQEVELPFSYCYKQEELNTILEDYNFDGYLDLVVYHRFPFQARRDYGLYLLIYNPVSKKFDYQPQYREEFGHYVRADHLKEVLVVETADGRGNESKYEYKVIDDNFYLVRYWSQTEFGDSEEISYEVRDGKSVEINRR
ncbi:hypothetical protein GJV76_09015 [Myroides sp. BIT-d1]|uniref:Uncharacterized protein n=1 Tax=Myroides albus TaxID=2562892 RepID=A0A6I3LFL7_9FLAO|nr:hypothetical protein [Myroides albus]MTG98269.1 hypothetical protein [Myroides albus]